jgi:hypothetical protein
MKFGRHRDVRTQTSKGTDADGKPFTETLAFDKQ